MLYGIDPTLDPRFLPEIRESQDSDNQDVLDYIGDYLKSENIPQGRIPQRDRNKILKGAVSFLYQQMQRTISTLNHSQLLSFLITQNESFSEDLVREREETGDQIKALKDLKKMVLVQIIIIIYEKVILQAGLMNSLI